MKITLIGDSTIRYLYLTIVTLMSSNNTLTRDAFMHCKRECAWNEKTFNSWPHYFHATTPSNMFCDCHRSGNKPESWLIVENRYATVLEHEINYLLLFKEPIFKGNWLPGQSDKYRFPHENYTVQWRLPPENITTILGSRQDIILWNMGLHRCDKSIPSLHEIISRAANRTIFLTNIGNPVCKVHPGNTTEVYFVNQDRKRSDYWDRGTHLNGRANWMLANNLLDYIDINSTSLPHRQ